jgi:prepilin-type N-terminal cleavage/methylation domain-containing protein
MKRFKLLDSRGDTIIEVLIVLAVLSLALAMSYATADRGLRQSRNAEEHSQALGVLTSQVELVRKAVANQTNVFITNQPFCMTANATPVTGFASGAGVADPKTDALAGYPAACKNGAFYNQSITYDSTNGTFTFRIHWDGQGDLGRQQELMTYRIQALGATANQGVPLTASPTRIRVLVQAVRPNASNDQPSCSDANTRTASGESTVVLTQTNGGGIIQTQRTTSSVALFDAIVDIGTYSATLSQYPAKFTPCPPVVASVSNPTPGATTDIRLRILPQCWLDPFTRDYLGTWADYIGTYADYLGTYSDPPYAHYSAPYNHYSPEYWHHDGPDGRQSVYRGETYYTIEGGLNVRYDHFGVGTDNPWYNRFVYYADYYGYYSDYIGTYSDGPYDHYTVAYDHYTAAYAHYGPWYQPKRCPS